MLLFVGVGVASLTDSVPLDIGFLLGAVSPLAVLAPGPLATVLLGAATTVLLTVPFFHLNRPGSTDPFTLGFVATLSALEVLTKALDVSVGDEAGGEAEEGFVDVVASFP
ncbi:hypothetical protein ACFYUS_28890, partial [Streptomyces sp. NPDC004284]